MGIHSVQPGLLKETNAPESPGVSKTKTPQKSTPSNPTLRQRKEASARKPVADATVLKTHSEPRAQIRVDKQAVDQALGKTAELVKKIAADRQPGFYKHASMMINGPASDKSFLLDCLAKLYMSAPNPNHPNASDPEWVDDQDVLWGDELLFLFEVAQQVDKLSNEGKAYFSNALASRAGVVRSESGSIAELENILLKAKHYIGAEAC